MNNLHMTDEDWNRYFNESPSPAEKYIDNLIEGLDSGFLDYTTGLIRLQEIRVKMDLLAKAVTKRESKSQRRFH